MEKCGHRYHVLNTERATGTQLTGLLEIIDVMVVGNGGCHFEMERKWLQKVEGMTTKRYMRTNQRRKMVREQWETPLVQQGKTQGPDSQRSSQEHSKEHTIPEK